MHCQRLVLHSQSFCYLTYMHYTFSLFISLSEEICFHRTKTYTYTSKFSKKFQINLFSKNLNNIVKVMIIMTVRLENSG